VVVFDLVIGRRPFEELVGRLVDRHEPVQRPGGKETAMLHRERHWWFVVGLSIHQEGDREDIGRGGGVVIEDEHIAQLRS